MWYSPYLVNGVSSGGITARCSPTLGGEVPVAFEFVKRFCKVIVQPIFLLFSVQNPDICTHTESHDLSTVLDSFGISGSAISVVLH